MTAIAQAPETAPEKKRLFSAKRIYGIPIPGPEGTTVYRVRFPTDEEWSERARRLITVRRNLGRDATHSDYKDELPIDLELVEKLLADEDQKLDDWTAKTILDVLLNCDTGQFEQGEGEGYYVIEMMVLGCHVKHRLKCPTPKQAGEYNRGAFRTMGRRNTLEIRLPLEPSGELWSQLLISVDGYENDGEVPIIHKRAALDEMIGLIQNKVQSGVDPEG